uniref:Uncharacterized protein n=1 Tax=Kalanchoe fedtschenkoi TaxID=63787 RepID=A0A7N0VBJ0_KALFE
MHYRKFKTPNYDFYELKYADCIYLFSIFIVAVGEKVANRRQPEASDEGSRKIDPEILLSRRDISPDWRTNRLSVYFLSPHTLLVAATLQLFLFSALLTFFPRPVSALWNSQLLCRFVYFCYCQFCYCCFMFLFLAIREMKENDGDAVFQLFHVLSGNSRGCVDTEGSNSSLNVRNYKKDKKTGSSKSFEVAHSF